jgi:hypothetical protein
MRAFLRPGPPFAENRVIHRPPNAIRRNPVFLALVSMYRHLILSTEGKVNTENSYEWRRQLLWGLVLIGVGITFFLDQMDYIVVEGLWHYWPLLLVVIGINKMIGYPTAKHFTSGLWTMFVGLWLFAVIEHEFGLTFGNSWPLPIIACGITMVIEPLIKKRFAPNEESGK